MKTKYELDCKFIKSILAKNMHCDECFFGIKKDRGWGCNHDEIDKWNVPDCVFGYHKPRIYKEISNENT